MQTPRKLGEVWKVHGDKKPWKVQSMTQIAGFTSKKWAKAVSEFLLRNQPDIDDMLKQQRELNGFTCEKSLSSDA